MTTRRVPRARAYAPDPDAPGRLCDTPGCEELGCYRAPKSRLALNNYYWFCLDHVRAYNAKWDYYKDMTPGQIEQELRADASWQRPTWRLGSNGTAHAAQEELLRDPLLHMDGRRPGPAHETIEAPPELRQPLGVLGLTWPVSLDTVKARYKALAKRHHPDANGGGDTADDHQIKAINSAYTTLKLHWPAEERQASRG